MTDFELLAAYIRWIKAQHSGEDFIPWYNWEKFREVTQMSYSDLHRLASASQRFSENPLPQGYSNYQPS